MKAKTTLIIGIIFLFLYSNTQGDTVTNVGSATTDLIKAIEDANTRAGTDILILTGQQIYTFSSAHTQDPDGYGPVALPPVKSKIIIKGNGATITRSTGNFRFFYIANGGDLTLESLTVSKGNFHGYNGGNTYDTRAYGGSAGTGGGSAGMGGAIFNCGILQMEGVTFEGNIATGGNGGIVNNYGRDAKNQNTSAFDEISSKRWRLASGYGGGGGGGLGGNGIGIPDPQYYSADARGGGINGGTNDSKDGGIGGGGAGSSCVDAESVSEIKGGNGGFGGGGGGGAVIINGTHMHQKGGKGGNGGFGGGGGGSSQDQGINVGGLGGFGAGSGYYGLGGGGGGAGMGGAIFQKEGSLHISNCTFYKNNAYGGSKGYPGGTSGGGIGGAIFHYSGTLSVVNSTFSKNTGVGAVYLYRENSTETPSVTIVNSIIAHTVNGSDINTNLAYNYLAADQRNIIMICPASVGQAWVTTDPQLADNLEDNGGPTKTLSLTAGSPAVKNANEAYAPKNDQRFFQRKEHPDIGAFEYGASSTTLTMAVNPTNAHCSTLPAIGSYSEGIAHQQYIQAIPSSVAHFTKWTVNGKGIIDDPLSKETFIVLSGDATATANFTVNLPTATLTLAALPDEHGNTDPAKGQHTVYQTVPYKLKAIPGDNYHFVKWSVSGPGKLSDPNKQETFITLTGDTTVTAHFVIGVATTLTLSASPNNMGTTTPIPGTHNTYTEKSIPIEARSYTGFYFRGWQADSNAIIANPFMLKTSVILKGASTVTAIFGENYQNVTLTMAASGNGSTNPGIGEHKVHVGEPVSIAAHADAGHHFVKWTIEGEGTLQYPLQSETVATLKNNATVTAHFAPSTSQVTLDIKVSGSEAGTTNPGAGRHLVNSHESISLSAHPHSGYHFVNWTVSGPATIANLFADKTSIMLTGDASVTANFAENTTPVKLTMAVSGAGTTRPATGEHTVYAGQTIELTADAADGYHFVNWTIDGQINIADPNLKTTYVTLTGDGTATANFVVNSQNVSLTLATVGEGTTNPGIGNHTVHVNEPISIEAHAQEGCHFIKWTVSGKATLANPFRDQTSVILRGDATITAYFALNTTLVPLEVKVTKSETGTTNPGVGEHMVNSHESFSISAQAKEGYHFVKWTVTGQITVANPDASDTCIVVTGNAVLTANFAENTEPVKLSLLINGNGGTFPLPGEHTVYKGQPVKIIAKADNGSHFVNWSVNGDIKIADPNLSTTWVILTGNGTATANFAENTSQVELTVTCSPEAGGNTNPGQGTYTVNAGESLKVEAQPANGYHFVNWTSAGDISIANPKAEITSVVLKGAAELKAHFAINTATGVLTLGVNPENKGTTNPGIGEHTVYLHENTTIEAFPAAGFFFKGWAVKGNAQLASSEMKKTMVVLNGEKAEVTAQFAPVTGTANLTIAVSPDGSGTTVPGVGTQTVNIGAPVTIEDKAADGFYFINWTSDGDAKFVNSESAETSVTISKDTTVTAKFGKNSDAYSLTVGVSPEDAGTTNPETGNHAASFNQKVSITAIPATGYVFLRWTAVGNCFIDDPYSAETLITVKGNTTLTALFAEESQAAELTLVVSSNNGGTLNPTAGTYNVVKGEAFAIKAVPYNGFVFVGWTSSSTAAQIAYSSSTETTVTITENTTITAAFAVSNNAPKVKFHLNLCRNNYAGIEEIPQDRVFISHAPMSLLDFDPDNDTVTITVDGFPFTLNNDNGVFFDNPNGFTYKSEDQNITFKMNMIDEHWYFKAKNVELTGIDTSDGINITLETGDNHFGANYTQIAEHTNWSYSINKNAESENLVLNNMRVFDVELARGSYNLNKRKHDFLSIQEATIELADGVVFDPENDDVIIHIDNAFIPIPAGSFIEEDPSVFNYYGTEKKMKVKLDFISNKWSLYLPKAEKYGTISNQDGLDIYLTIGNAEGGCRLKGRHRSYIHYNAARNKFK